MGYESEFMPFTKVDEKGRVVLPSELRTKLEISLVTNLSWMSLALMPSF